jgi:NAD(P)-dependent dehydrogenase (short-subunit alcohol dehydrogenase family)
MTDWSEELRGKVAVVTGSGDPGGIGAATARALADAGARIVVADLPTSSAAEVAETLRADGFEAAHCHVDISEESTVEELMRFTLDRFGSLDVLDNNAASNHLVPLDRDLLSMTVDVWDRMFAVIARGTMLMCKHAVPIMLEQQKGSIINISSGKSLAGDVSEAAYSAAKSAVNSLTRTVATMFGKGGVRCNTVSPGVIQTELMRAVVPPAQADLIRKNNLVPELGWPQDIANLVVFLASDRSSYISGQLIPVDGGFSAHLPSLAGAQELGSEYHLRPLENSHHEAELAALRSDH